METISIMDFTPDQTNPASASHEKDLSRKIGKVYENKLQFDEAVQRLLEEYERHSEASRGIFY